MIVHFLLLNAIPTNIQTVTKEPHEVSHEPYCSRNCWYSIAIAGLTATVIGSFLLHDRAHIKNNLRLPEALSKKHDQVFKAVRVGGKPTAKWWWQ